MWFFLHAFYALAVLYLKYICICLVLFSDCGIYWRENSTKSKQNTERWLKSSVTSCSICNLFNKNISKFYLVLFNLLNVPLCLQSLDLWMAKSWQWLMSPLLRQCSSSSTSSHRTNASFWWIVVIAVVIKMKQTWKCSL